MVRRRMSSPRPSAPVRSAAPPSRPRAAAPPPPAPPMRSAQATPIGGMPPPQAPGLMAQMAATAGGVAIGSAVGHAVGNMMTGGGGSSGSEEVAQAPAAQAGAPQVPQNQQALTQPCEFEWKQFLECSQNQRDLSLCEAFNEAFKQCRARYA
ncbi:unnamed protein product [Anisakis simplex]|uniref:Hemiasterlin resistant protein 1 (inferred by orthology to a C. elegans protein) n=1 Tax=Anisakis simplex TaxID=6269 RepID=A0A0M3KDZ7_ANISI|nr:unnamed protein product [Anisakis simplex]